MSVYGGRVIGSRVVTIDVRVELVDASKNLFLLHDNSRAPRAAAVTAFLENKQLKMLPHSPCSPDLAPRNYFSSLRLRITTKGRRCDGVWDIRKAATSFLEQTPQKDAQRSFGASVGRADKMKHFPRNGNRSSVILDISAFAIFFLSFDCIDASSSSERRFFQIRIHWNHSLRQKRDFHWET